MELQRCVSSIQHTSTLSATAGAFTPAATSSGLVPGGHSLPAAGHKTPHRLPLLMMKVRLQTPPSSLGALEGMDTGGGLEEERMALKQTPPPPLPVRDPIGYKRDRGSLTRSNSRNLEVRRDILIMSWRPSDTGKGALVTREIITRMNRSNLYLSLSGDASQVYDWVVRSIRTPDGKVDLGALLAKFREHYCGSLKFREQRNQVKSLRQGSGEDAVDFLIRVGSAIERLVKEWNHSITPLRLTHFNTRSALMG